MNGTWGWLVTENVAPFWILKMGVPMMSGTSKACRMTLPDYLNGKAPRGPVLSSGQQPIRGDWWA